MGWHALSNHVKGAKTKLAWAEENSHLKPAEAQALIDFALSMANRGFPLTHKTLAKYVLEIKCIHEPNAMPFGHLWTHHFLARYGDLLSTKWSASLNSVCASAVNPIKVKAWFNLLEEVFNTYHFPPWNIYNFDESGFAIGKGSKQCVITQPGTRTQHTVEDGNKENVTVMCTICTDGTSLTPVVIFKGKNFQS